MKSIDLDLLSVLTGVLLLALALARFLEAPIRPFMNALFLGSPLGVNLSATNLMYLIILGIAITGTAAFLRSHPLWDQAEIKHSYMLWIGPGLLSIALSAGLNQFAEQRHWAFALLVCVFLMPLSLLIEYGEIESESRTASWRHWGLLALTHLSAAILFSLIYAVRARSMLSGTAVLLIALLLAARLFWPYFADLAQPFQYAAIVGLTLGLMTWVLNYWRLTDLQGGLLLLLLFYVMTGLIQQFLQGQFDDSGNGRRIWYEYGIVTIVGILIIAAAIP